MQVRVVNAYHGVRRFFFITCAVVYAACGRYDLAMRRRLLQGTRFLVRYWDLVVVVVVLAISFAVQMRYLHLAAAPGTDEGVHVEAGRMMLEGYVPYRDFSYLHPPVLPLFAAAGLSVFHGMYGVRVVFLLLNTLSLGLLFAVIRTLTKDRGAALLALAFMLTYHEMLFHDWRFLASRQLSNVFVIAYFYLGVTRLRGARLSRGFLRYWQA